MAVLCSFEFFFYYIFIIKLQFLWIVLFDKSLYYIESKSTEKIDYVKLLRVEKPFTYANKHGNSTFMDNLYQMVSDDSTNKIISWQKDFHQIVFVIEDPVLFRQIILPKYFQHGNFKSFIRQLNMYQFQKRNRREINRYIFYHPYFQEGQEKLLEKIKRNVKSRRRQKTKTVKRQKLPKVGDTPLKICLRKRDIKTKSKKKKIDS